MTRCKLLVSLFAVAILTGCSGTVQDRLGLRNKAPDEFQVVRRAPLVVPPDYNLRPPEEAAAAASRDEQRANRQLLTGRQSVPVTGRSVAERALLAQVDVQPLPHIRTQLLEDVDNVRALDEGRFLAILDWQRPQFDGDEALDPQSAAEELAAQGGAARVVTNRVLPNPTEQQESSE